MEDSYTELLAAWEDIRVKPNDFPPELLGEMLTLAREARRWLDGGENDTFRAKLEELRGHVARTALPRRAAYEIALTMMAGMPFIVDDPVEPDEPFAFRCWRTVELGFEVMDARLAKDPGFKAFPRQEWVVSPRTGSKMRTRAPGPVPKGPSTSR